MISLWLSISPINDKNHFDSIIIIIGYPHPFSSYPFSVFSFIGMYIEKKEWSLSSDRRFTNGILLRYVPSDLLHFFFEGFDFFWVVIDLGCVDGDVQDWVLDGLESLSVSSQLDWQVKRDKKEERSSYVLFFVFLLFDDLDFAFDIFSLLEICENLIGFECSSQIGRVNQLKKKFLVAFIFFGFGLLFDYVR